MPTLTWKAVEIRSVDLRAMVHDVHHFDARLDRDIRRGPYMVTSAQLKMCAISTGEQGAALPQEACEMAIC